jgi:hypothetical protein
MADEDTVRALVGDTDTADQLLSSSQITSFLGQRSIATTAGTAVNVTAAAADAAGAIAAKFARDYDVSEDGQSFSRSERVAHYLELERALRRRAGGASLRLGLAGTEIP